MGCIHGTVVGTAWTGGADIWQIWRLGIFTGGSPYLGSLTGELYLYEEDDWTLILPLRGNTSCGFLGQGSRLSFQDQTLSSNIEKTALKACRLKNPQF